MRVALVNPPWSFEGSIYFGCREPHLPLELGYTQALLQRAGHQTLLLDGHLLQQSAAQLCDEIADFAPDMTVVTTAPSYLFWRCAPPELRVPAAFLRQLAGRGGRTIAVGPHGSATPGATLRKLGVDLVVRGECEAVVAALADAPLRADVPGTAHLDDDRLVLNGAPASSPFVDQPPLAWPSAWLQRHRHHHHRFETETPAGFGAEVEASRGCPYACSFCAKLDFRDQYRRRAVGLVLAEIDALIAQGVGYIYFIDEIFLPRRELLQALVDRPIAFGIQTRIDLWRPELLQLLGRAGCVSIEAGVESLTVAGRAALAKRCRLDTEELADLLIIARRHVPFVQANLIGAQDAPELVVDWRQRLLAAGVWANEPVPLYPYPSSPSYRTLWGEPDDHAWERAHAHYLAESGAFSDIQDARPLPLARLEADCCGCG